MNFLKPVQNLEPHIRRSLFITAMVSFTSLFAYPIVRSSTTSIFLESEGAKKSPLVWLFSVIVLSLVVTVYNKTQVKYSIHKLFLATTLFSFMFFIAGLYAHRAGMPGMSYALYIWKECYIVLVIHMAFGFMNNMLNYQVATILYGPIGAMGSIGGILGGLLTSSMTSSLKTEGVLMMGAFIILLSGVLFWMTDHSLCLSKTEENKHDHGAHPIQTIKNIRSFVILMVLVVALSQFTINIANFKFNLIFDGLVQGKDLKTAALGKIYSSINSISLFFNIIVVPLALRVTSLRNVLFFIPSMYLAMSLWGFTLSPMSFFPVAATFAIFKGADYSLFSTAKELLYFGLTPKQKYGTKYLVDMVSYRASKGLISFILLFLQGPGVLSFLLYSFLVLWIILIVPLTRVKERIQSTV